MAKLRVVLIATSLMPGRSGGGRTFIEGLIDTVSRSDQLEMAVIGSVEDETIGTQTAATVLPVPARHSANRVLHDLLRLDSIASSWRPDLIHYPHEWVPRCNTAPVAITIQNVMPFVPETCREFWLRGPSLRGLAQRTAHRASAVSAVSRYAAERYSSVVGSRATRPVTVIPETFLSPPRSDKKTTGMVLGIAGLGRYKNDRLLLQAFQLIAERIAGVELVTVGFEHVPVPHIAAMGVRPRNEVLDLMARAAVTVYLSRVESFGLPAFESVAVGTPCVVIEGTPMVEWPCAGISSCAMDASAIADHVAELLRAVPPEVVLPSALLAENVVHSWERFYKSAAER